jgi:hypothetical protein
VWISVRADREWGQVVNVLRACQEGGIHRIGLQVQAESGQGVFGFPLFLPHNKNRVDPNAPKQKARRLDVRLEAAGGERSYTPRLFAAAKAAVERFAPVVAEISISVRSRVQDAVTAIDLLYRAGCASVRMRYRMMVRSLSATPTLQLWVADRLLPPEAMEIPVPPVRVRTTPWNDNGAAEEGAWAFELEAIDDGSPKVEEKGAQLQPLPSYAALGGEVPSSAMAEASQAVQTWSDTLGGWLHRILANKRVNVPETLVVKRRRQGLGVKQMFADARAAFAGTDSVKPSTLRIQAYLFQGNTVAGKVDVTLNMAGTRLDVVFANWVTEQFPTDLILPPHETEAYASGTPGQLRVLLEGLMGATRARGSAAIPLAPEADLLKELPPIAHRSVRQAIARRGPAIDAFAAWLRVTPYDRVLVAAVDGQAGVHAKDGRVVGVLRYALEGEAGNLSLANLGARVAPR